MIYVDENFCCYAEAGDGRTAYNVPFFDGKCPKFIEGYYYVPSGAEWVQPDGITLKGELFALRCDYALLEEFQRQYEGLIAQQEDMKAALELLGVTNEEETA